MTHMAPQGKGHPSLKGPILLHHNARFILKTAIEIDIRIQSWNSSFGARKSLQPATFAGRITGKDKADNRICWNFRKIDWLFIKESTNHCSVPLDNLGCLMSKMQAALHQISADEVP